MTAEVYTHLMRERYEEGRNLMDSYIAAAPSALRAETPSG